MAAFAAKRDPSSRAVYAWIGEAPSLDLGWEDREAVNTAFSTQEFRGRSSAPQMPPRCATF